MNDKNKKHLVLDLDATLIHTFFIEEINVNKIKNSSEFNFLKNRSKIIRIVDINDDAIIGRGEITTALVILRPYLEEFVEFILGYFDSISIWSAGHKRYVRAIESLIFNPNNELYRDKIVKVLTRRDCNEITSTRVLKDLSTKDFSLNDTIIIDDNNTTFVNNFHNAINIPAYTPKLSNEEINYDDKSLLRIIDWIKENDINNCEDVRKINKEFIFK